MDSCFSYGIGHGCDEYCPVLNEGKCEIYEDVEDYLSSITEEEPESISQILAEVKRLLKKYLEKTIQN